MMMDTIVASRRKLAEDFDGVIEDAEKLLAALAATGTNGGNALRASAERTLETARASLKELQEGSLDRSREAARATDAYVRGNPWQALGIAAALTALAGFVVGLMMNRR